MKKIKIVQKFFSKSDANCQVTYQRAKAKKAGILITNIEIVCAYKLYQVNGWFKNNPFKKLGLPMVDCFMVIVHYSANFSSPIALTTLKKKIVKAVKTNTTCSSFFIVTSIPTPVDIMGSILTPATKLSNAIAIQCKHLPIYSKGKNKMIPAIHPLNTEYMIAA